MMDAGSKVVGGFETHPYKRFIHELERYPMRIAILRLLAIVLLSAPASPALAEAPSTKTVEIDSPAVGRKLKYTIALPANYESSDKRYPVLYLLHGYTSDYTAWPRLGAAKAAEPYELIVVSADAGNSWYVNWAKSEDGQKNNWEDAIVKDLVGHVDSTYRTIASREGRAINGLSMGGYGALTLGLRHPDMFCSIGSHSGAIAIGRSLGERLKANPGEPLPKRVPPEKVNPLIDLEDFDGQAERTPKGQIFETVEQSEAHDPFKLVLNVPREKLPHINIDCGTEDRLVGANQEFMKLLMEKKIPFTYAQSVGGHNPPYWTREIGHSMAIQYHILRRNLAEKDKDAATSTKTETP